MATLGTQKIAGAVDRHKLVIKAGGETLIIDPSRFTTGLDLARPLTDNLVGDAYFTTDTLTLYVWTGTAWKVSGGAGALAFTDLLDCPGGYGGKGGYYLQVKLTEDGIELTPIAVPAPGTTIVAGATAGQSATVGASAKFMREDGSPGTPPNSAYDHDQLTNFVAAEHRNVAVGTLGARPGASTANNFYYCTDTQVLYRDTGAAWQEVGPVRSKSFFLLAPVGTDDVPWWRTEAGITLVATDYLCLGAGTDWTGQVQECDANGINGADTQAADTNATAAGGNVEVVAYTNATIDAGDYVGIKTAAVTGAPTLLVVTIYYRLTT